MELNEQETTILVSVIDAGIRAVGLQVFKDGNGAVLQSVLDKIQPEAKKDED